MSDSDKVFPEARNWEEANLLRHLPQLKNTYFGLRHGRAESNEKGIFVTRIELGSSGYGLVGIGAEQVRRSIAAAKDTGKLNRETLILSSDFLRARESAEIAASLLQVTCPVKKEPRLGERFFGLLDLQPDSGPQLDTIRDQDVINPMHSTFDVESPAHVIRRMSGLILELEAAYERAVILLVSHGDPLRILRAGFHLAQPGEPVWHIEVANGELIALPLGG